MASKNNPVPIRVPHSGNAEVDHFNNAMKNTSFVLWHALFDTVPVPASATASGTPGQIAYATGFLYICIAPDTWERAVIATW